jgi:4-aminobutyrate aminotransferase-like enzyme
MVVSHVHIKEIDAIFDIYERIELQERIQSLGEKVMVDLETTKKRAEEGRS